SPPSACEAPHSRPPPRLRARPPPRPAAGLRACALPWRDRSSSFVHAFGRVFDLRRISSLEWQKSRGGGACKAGQSVGPGISSSGRPPALPVNGIPELIQILRCCDVIGPMGQRAGDLPEP